MLLNDLISDTFKISRRKDKIAKRHALRLSISIAWSLAKNNQIFREKYIRQSMTAMMKRDLENYAEEPVPAPIDNYVSQLPRSKVKIKMPESPLLKI